MPGDPKQPVTVGSLWFLCEHGKTETHQLRLGLSADCPGGHPATVADLVSALRAEGVLVVEKVDGEWPWSALGALVDAEGWARLTKVKGPKATAIQMLDALAEAQPFPPEGG